MTLTQRRFLTLFLGLLLLVASPLVILYAAGYRYNIEKHRIEKVGLLYVTTDPDDTQISVNGQQHRVGNELILRSIPSGQHQVTLSADGYFPWSKTLEINKGQSTFIIDQLLFLDQEEEPFDLFVNKLDHKLSVENLHFFQSTNFLIIYDYQDSSFLEIDLENNTPLTEIKLSPNKKTLVFKQGSEWKMLTISTSEIIPITATVNTSKIIPSDTTLFAITDKGVHTITETNTNLLLSQPYIQDLLINNEGFWILTTENTNQHTFLYRVYLNELRPQLVDQYPYSENFTLVEDYRGFLTMHDATNYILYLVDTSPTIPTTEALFDVRDWEWNANHTSLLTSTEFEVTIHHFENGITQELLVRLSTPIGNTGWYEDESHVFYTKYGSIFIIERDGRDRRNEYELGDISDDFLLLGSDKDSLEYFSSQESASLFIRRTLRK